MINDQSSIIERIQNEERLLHSQVWSISEQWNAAKDEVNTLQEQRDMLEEQNRNFNWQLQVTNGNMYDLRNLCSRNDEELSVQSNTIKVLSDHNQQLQQRIAHAERIVASTSQASGTNIQTFFDRYSELEAAHNEAMVRLEAESLANVKSQDYIQTLESENASLKTVINELQKDASGLEICQPQTLRSLLTMRIADQAHVDEEIEDETGLHAQSWSPRDLPENDLDVKRTPVEIQHLANLLPTGPGHNQFYRRLELKACHVCGKPKFRLRTQPRHNISSTKWLYEYLGKTRYFTCCYEQVCKECFIEHMLECLRSQWWYKLGSLQWFPCPMEGCGESLGIRCEADLEICLERSCDIAAEEHVKT